MKLTLDQNTMQMMNMFHNLTGATAVDCITDEDCIYFVVSEGQYGLAVGKGGAKVKNAEKVFKKPIKVFEFSEGAENFVRKMVPDSQEISTKDRTVFIKVGPKDRAKVIGKAGKNIKVINRFLQRLFDVDELKVK